MVKPDFTCDFCDFAAKNKDTFYKHLTNIHHFCLNCDTKYENKEEIFDHLKKEHGEIFHKCSKCEFLCKRRDNYLFHGISRHYSCFLCKKETKFDNRNDIDEHVKKKHKNEKIFQMKKCPYCEFQCMINLKNHINKDHSEVQECNICNKTFSPTKEEGT